MSSASTSSHVDPFHRWHLGLLRETLGGLASPQGQLWALPTALQYRCPPSIQTPLLGGALRDLSLAGLFLELLMTLFAFPMTSNVPLPWTPPPCRVPSSPPRLSPAGQEAPWHVSLPALVHSPACPWPWPLVLDETVRWNAAPSGVRGVGG